MGELWVEPSDLGGVPAVDRAPDLAPYFSALEAFDEIPQLQELKVLARARIAPDADILDVGCGFGLESLKLARLVEPGGHVTGIDKSAAFIREAQSRARQAKAAIDFQVGDAEALPFTDGAFDVARAERLLVYLPDPKTALKEMRRVTRKGGTVTAIEPDLGTNAINFPDRDLAVVWPRRTPILSAATKPSAQRSAWSLSFSPIVTREEAHHPGHGSFFGGDAPSVRTYFTTASISAAESLSLNGFMSFPAPCVMTVVSESSERDERNA